MSVDSKQVRTTLGKHILADGYEPVMDLEKSHGSWLGDERDGTEYLDMFSMFASGAVGYNHPDIEAQKERLTLAALYKPTLSDIYNVFYAEFLETFSRIAIPEYLPHTFFIEGGALGVENALKVAFDWKVRKNMAAGKGEKGSKVIHFKQAFHGRSGYTLSLTNTADLRKTMYFPKFDWPRIDIPKLSFPITDIVLQEVEKSEKLAKQNLQETTRVKAGIARTAIAVTTKHGDTAMFDTIVDAFKKATLPNVKNTLLYSMSFTDKETVNKMLDIALTDLVTPANTLYMVVSVSRNLEDKTLLYSWMNENLDALIGKMPDYHVSRMPEFVSTTCDTKNLNLAKAFYAPLKEKHQGMARSYDVMLDKTQQCLRLKDTFQEGFNQYVSRYSN